MGGNGKPDLEHQGEALVFLDIPISARKSGQQYILLIHLDQADLNGFERNWAAFDAKVGMHIGMPSNGSVFSLFVFRFSGCAFTESAWYKRRNKTTISDKTKNAHYLSTEAIALGAKENPTKTHDMAYFLPC